MADDRFYVKSLTLENFRCFEKTELGPFDPHFNLLVGTNGSGKSSVLLALANLFRALAARGGVPKSHYIVDQRDVKHGAPEEIVPNGAELPYAAWILNSKLRWQADDLSIQEIFHPQPALTFPHVTKVEHSGRQSRLDNGFFTLLSDRRELLLFYRVDRKFRNHSANISSTIPAGTGPAYLDWDRAGQTIQELQDWFRDQELRALQAERKSKSNDSVSAVTYRVVQNAVRDAFQDARTIEYDAERKDIVLEFHSGERRAFSEMSDGQRALAGLVADIAYRGMTLVSDVFGSRSLQNITGLVLIDEIDLHLHPKWQRQIVPALKRIFPKIQFFATTHSPQVIGEALPHEIVLLGADGQQRRPAGGYGMDSNWILECVMDAEGRDPEVAKRIKALFNLIEEDRLDEAKLEIRKLNEELPSVAPDIVSAEAYIWNLEHNSDEAAE